MKFIIIIYTTNKLTVVEMADIRGVRLRKFKLRKIILGVRMHFRHITMAVSVAVCEIFSAKEWCDLENGVRVRSRSLEMAPFDRSHTSSYSPSI